MLERPSRDRVRKGRTQVHREPGHARRDRAADPGDPNPGLVIEPPGARLDAIARALFDHDEGRMRLDPVLARFDAIVGAILDDDEDRELLLTARLDWVLCDAPLGEHDAHDTWLSRVLSGRVPGLVPLEGWSELGALHAGLFEVWPGRGGTFIRDVLHGLSLTLEERFDVDPFARTNEREPAALWDVRVWLGPGGVRLVRPPLVYPVAVLPIVREAMTQRFHPGGRAPTLLRLRHAWLAWQRRPRLSPMALFAHAVT